MRRAHIVNGTGMDGMYRAGQKLRQPKVFAVIALGLLLLIGLLSSIKIIQPGEIGVVSRLGRVTGVELGEGLSFRLPYGIERVHVYDVKVQKNTEEVAAASRDLQDVHATLALNYHVQPTRVSDLHQSVGVLYNDKVINPALNEVFKEVAAKFSAQELITQRAQVKKDAFDSLKSRIEKYGIIVDDLSLVNFSFSDSFTKAIEEKQVAEQNAERAKFNLEAARTDAEAQRAQAETLSDLYLRKQAIDKWDGKLPQYVGGGENVFNIPLR